MFLRRLALVFVVAVTLLAVPRWLAGRGAGAWFDGDLATQDALARTVIANTLEHKGTLFYKSGYSRFDGQSAVATYQMTLLGLGQILLEHPEKKEAYLPAMRAAAERLASVDVLRYAEHVYGHHGVTHMGAGEGHAYLGYVNLGLGMLRMFDPQHPLSAVHDRITEQLAARLDASPHGLIETYPGETWPPDVAAVAGSIGLHAHATGKSWRGMLDRWADRFAACSIHASGMLVQRLATGSCRAVDAPRGSGTAVAAYFIAFAHAALAERLYGALQRRSFVGFGGVREYPEGQSGAGDVNAGPIVFGLSVGASGFALGASRVHGDREGFVSLYRSTHLLGVPTTGKSGSAFAAGGALGNALLLAMLTARVPK
jgi:hypothetical protein